MDASKPSSIQSLQLNSNTQKLGADYEKMALAYLLTQGLQLLHQNWLQPKVGEIDLIMLEHVTNPLGRISTTLVFIEVKVRTHKSATHNSNFAQAVNSITKSKQRKIIKTAQHFLQVYSQYQDYDCRFDVMVYDVTQDKTGEIHISYEWITAAFHA